MKLFVLLHGYAYEGMSFEGVYSSREAAVEAAQGVKLVGNEWTALVEAELDAAPDARWGDETWLDEDES
jgi:hypothetical protein